ncbi:hypothetical protein NC653_041624 [Populus alba x Populus x berolinensis]|uniref:Uncharacterized protein n=1 Tax=Populus alba x Populus x berolinensis TaxID=444605 RepID=A0AAD6PPI2_9ROSI|nr:hypothetical protein NC653_041624 [Populus alba x Populus x berolinensis]
MFLIHLRIIDHLRQDIYKCKPHHDFFIIRKHFSVHSYTGATTTYIRGFLGNDNTTPLPCDCDAYSISGRGLQRGSEKPSDHVTDILKDAGAVSCMWRASVVENKGSGYWNCTLLAAGILSTSHFFETVIGQSPQRRSYENKHPPPEHIITKFRICLDGGKSFLRQRNRLCVFCIFSIPKGLIMEFPRTQMVSGKFSEEHTIRHPVLALLWIHPNYLCCRLSSTLFTGNNTSSAMKLPLMNS